MDGLPSLGHKPGLLGRRRKIMIMMTMVIMMMMRSPDEWITLPRTQAKPDLFGKALNDDTKILTETDTETFFTIPNFPKPKPRLFSETKFFRNRNRYFSSETKFSETETFFRDQIFSKPKPRLFFRNQIFRNRNPQRFGKSFETEMSISVSQEPDREYCPYHI